MKKITSLIMAVLMLCTMLSVFAVPAFAENEPTEIKPEESGSYKTINIINAGNYIIKGDYSVNDISVGNPFMTDVTLTIPKGVTVTVTNDFKNFGTINVYGTLIISDSARSKKSLGTINIMGCGGGKLEGTIGANDGTVNTYNEHNFENDKCTYCGTYECMVTAKHNWVNGICSACNVKGCVIGQLKHNWVSGVCSVCGTKGCEIGELKHNWISGVCSVCDKHCDHKWDANTGKCTVCEYECRHNDGYTAGKCNICQQECKHGNTFTKTFCSDCGEEVKSTTTAIGSALSEGSLTIICSIAGIAVGFLAAMFIFKKKKPALASGENIDEE